MFSKAKIEHIDKKKVANYLTYALGELTIIITGILVAVYLNNRNAEIQQEETLNSILEVVQQDLRNDTVSLNSVISHYENKKIYFDKVTDTAYNRDTLKNCNQCHRLLNNRRLMKVSDNGFRQLDDFQNIRVNPDDSVTSYLLKGFNIILPAFDLWNEAINDDVLNTIELWRDNHNWFTVIMDSQQENNLSPEMYEYFSSIDYQNRVTYHEILVYENYMPILKSYKRYAQKALKMLDERLKRNQ